MRVFFYPLFFILFLLSFFLIEGEYRFYLFALWSFFLLFYSFFFEINQKIATKFSKLAIFLSLLFSLTLLFTSHLPISLEKFLFYLLSLAIFVFFSNLPKKYFDQKVFLYFLSAFSLIINFFVLFFIFSDPHSQLFPGMNLLVRTYGHNHYVAYLLLLMPIFWYQFLFTRDELFLSKKEIKFLTVILLFSSYLIIIFSLARLVFLISLIQLLLIFFFNKKYFLQSGKNSWARAISKTFIFIFLSVLLVFLFLSVPLNQKSKNICPLVFNQKELCEPLFKNDRFFYWQKAWLIFKTNPYFGSGLKTFNYSIRQFPIENHLFTSYAHNIFLHNLAETGLFVGGFFTFFIFYLFYRSFKLLASKNSQLITQFLYIAVTSSLLNALFDFDWHFFIIFSLTLIFLAMILNSQSLLNKENLVILKRENCLKIYFTLIFLISTFFAFSHFYANILYKKNNYDSLVKIFPYLNFQITNAINQDKLSLTNYQNLYVLYQYNPNFLYKFSLNKNISNNKKAELQIELSKIDPVLFIKNLDFERFSYREAQPLIDQTIAITKQYNFLNNVYFLDYWQQRNLAVQFFQFANEAYFDQNPQVATTLYKQAMLFNPFIMNDLRLAFIDDFDFNQVAIFFTLFQDFNPEDMGQYFYDYMNLYEQTLIYLFQNDRLDEFFVLSESMFKQQYNFSWFLWRDLITISKAPADKQRLVKVYEHFPDMTTWYDFLPEIEKIQTEFAK